MCLALGGCGNSSEVSLLDTGMTALQQQDYRAAIASFEQAVLKNENPEESYRGLGLAYMGQGDYESAISSFDKALSYAGMFPGALEYDINYYMAISYYKMEEYDAAIAIYDGIIEMCPKDVDAYFLRGSMELYMNDLDSAIEDFEKAIDLSRDNCSLYLDVYDCLRGAGYEEKAQEYLDTVLQADSKDYSEYDKGRIAFYNGEYAKACNYLEHIRQQGEADGTLITLLGECYKMQGQYEYAAVVYESYVNTNPDPEIYNQMGLCYVEQGEYALALTAFQNGRMIRENNACLQTLWLNEIACYEYMYEFELAAQSLAEYMLVFPSTPELEKEYAFLTTR